MRSKAVRTLRVPDRELISEKPKLYIASLHILVKVSAIVGEVGLFGQAHRSRNRMERFKREPQLGKTRGIVLERLQTDASNRISRSFRFRSMPEILTRRKGPSLSARFPSMRKFGDMSDAEGWP